MSFLLVMLAVLAGNVALVVVMVGVGALWGALSPKLPATSTGVAPSARGMFAVHACRPRTAVAIDAPRPGGRWYFTPQEARDLAALLDCSADAIEAHDDVPPPPLHSVS